MTELRKDLDYHIEEKLLRHAGHVEKRKEIHRYKLIEDPTDLSSKRVIMKCEEYLFTLSRIEEKFKNTKSQNSELACWLEKLNEIEKFVSGNG